MVCLVCIVPRFLVNVLPIPIHLLMGKIYRVLGWEYKKRERATAASPYKPPSNKTDDKIAGEPNPVAPDHPVCKTVGVDYDKLD